MFPIGPIAFVLGVVGLFLGLIIGIIYRKHIAEAKVGVAEDRAKKIVEDAEKNAESRKKEILLEAKEESIKTKNELEREVRERRNELSKTERRLVQKEETLDRKADSYERKEEQMNKKMEELDKQKLEVEELHEKQLRELERISGLTKEEAKNYLLGSIENDVKHEAAIMIKEIEGKAKAEAEKRSKEIVANAIQRCAVDHVTETTVSVVQLPNDEMKGRIIGREGRNIRAFETATGVDLIIFDTPEAITISSFDPIRREVARQALEKLISDGRIHPRRIEETVEKARREVELTIKKEGERAVMDAGVHGLHPELIKLIGRLKYRTSYGQNILKHSLEVSALAGLLAGELGADVTMAKRAGLLHDIGKGLDHEYEGTHVSIGVEVAKKFKENPIIIHAIRAHHNDVEPTSVIDFVVIAADAISAARPGARRENIENYIKRLEKLEEISNSFPGVETSYAVQAGREVRILVKPEAVSDDQIVILARDIVARIENELDYPGQIKVNVIRESRATEFAK